jgi:protein-S-isoprenylcysteine O-methyltransferase Ste14
VLLCLTIPSVLGSLLAFAIFLVYPFIIAKRIRHEEEFLAKELPGYEAYRKKVKYRMIPFVW